jgi:hypothetical protein
VISSVTRPRWTKSNRNPPPCQVRPDAAEAKERTATKIESDTKPNGFPHRPRSKTTIEQARKIKKPDQNTQKGEDPQSPRNRFINEVLPDALEPQFELARSYNAPFHPRAKGDELDFQLVKMAMTVGWWAVHGVLIEIENQPKGRYRWSDISKAMGESIETHFDVCGEELADALVRMFGDSFHEEGDDERVQ